MGKKKRIWAYTGSLIQPMARYMVSLTVNINPNDPKGSAVAEQIFQRTVKTNPKYLQPNLDLFWNVNMDQSNASINIKYINGWQTKYALENVKLNDLIDNIQYYNQHIEDIRNLQDQDDEYADEESEI